MKNKKLLPLICLTGAVLTACGGGGGKSSNKTVIKLYNFSGGVGDAWLKGAIERFTAANAETSFEEGKKGVNITFYGNTDCASAINSMKSSSEAILFTEKGDYPYTLANKGLVYELDDVLKSNAPGESETIESKIDVDYRDSLKGEDGKYYALPHYEWYPGLVYDRDAFNNARKPYYFAAPEEENVTVFDASVTSGAKTYSFGTGRFIKGPTGKKSCGNDGIYGTEDDGLPTSLQEFLVLCSYISKDVSPLAVAGNHHDYTAYLLEGILASMVGKEGIQNYYDFDGSVDVVTGYDMDNQMFCSNSGIPTPIYTPTTVTEATGYLTRKTVERYEVASLMKMLLDCNFFTNKSVNSSTNNLLTQKGFILGKDNGYSDYAAAMLVEGNYWYNEANTEGYFEQYEKVAKKSRNLGWMSLPSQVLGTVEPLEDQTQEGRKTPLLDTGASYCIVNKAVMNRGTEGFRTAVKDFVRFLYSDTELENFTATSGTCKAAIKYDFDKESVTSKLGAFQKDVLALKKSNGVVYTKVSSSVFRRHQGEFSFAIDAPIWKGKVGGINYESYFDAFKATGKNITVPQVFEGVFIDEETWKNNYLNK
ncbi:MAG: hypothetical protein MJ239_04150 [Bacilli bacterium]|nr:hypothetical protein [Bacilli bacterium]